MSTIDGLASWIFFLKNRAIHTSARLTNKLSRRKLNVISEYMNHLTFSNLLRTHHQQYETKRLSTRASHRRVLKRKDHSHPHTWRHGRLSSSTPDSLRGCQKKVRRWLVKSILWSSFLSAQVRVYQLSKQEKGKDGSLWKCGVHDDLAVFNPLPRTNMAFSEFSRCSPKTAPLGKMGKMGQIGQIGQAGQPQSAASPPASKCQTPTVRTLENLTFKASLQQFPPVSYFSQRSAGSSHCSAGGIPMALVTTHLIPMSGQSNR